MGSQQLDGDLDNLTISYVLGALNISQNLILKAQAMPFGVTFCYHSQKSTSSRFKVLSGSCLTAGGYAASFINQVCIMLVNSFTIPDGITNGAVWGLLKVFLPKACMQQSLAQSFEATAIGSVTRVNLTNIKESVMHVCDCDHEHDLLLVLDWTYCWVLDFLELVLT